MKIRNILFASLLATSTMAFANNGVYTTVTPLAGNTVVGQESIFKVKYKWLTDKQRSGKLFYAVIGTNCKGQIDIDKHSGSLPVSGETSIKCTFTKSAVFKSDTFLQLYDETTKKEASEHEAGTVVVTDN